MWIVDYLVDPVYMVASENSYRDTDGDYVLEIKHGNWKGVRCPNVIKVNPLSLDLGRIEKKVTNEE
jgi:hypothetical protein